MTVGMIIEDLLARLQRIAPDVSPNPTASLSEELGLDSLQLLAFASEVRIVYGHVDLTPWLCQNAAQSNDSIVSLSVWLRDQRQLPLVADTLDVMPVFRLRR